MVTDQMQGEVNILMQHIFLVWAHLVSNLLPRGCTNSHIRAKKQALAMVGLVNMLANSSITLQRELASRHIIIRHRPGGTHSLRVLSKQGAHRFHPVGAQHRIGVNAA